MHKKHVAQTVTSAKDWARSWFGGNSTDHNYSTKLETKYYSAVSKRKTNIIVHMKYMPAAKLAR